MNMDTLSILYYISNHTGPPQPIFIQNTPPLHNNKKKPSVIFKQKTIDLNQTFHHTIENIGIT